MIHHSPGPWKDEITEDGDLIVVIPFHDQYCDRLDFGDMEVTAGEDHANARLVASAPDLLDACFQALDLIERVGDSSKDLPVLEALRAAISKATSGWGE